MINYLLKNLSILKKFLFINLIFFSVIGLFTFLYIKNVQPNLIKNKSSNHIKIINNTVENLDRLEIKFNEDDIRKYKSYKVGASGKVKVKDLQDEWAINKKEREDGKSK